MAKAQKNTATDHPEGGNLPFEEALRKLESIVESMESDELPLETLMARAEEGHRLAQLCQTKLNDAELKLLQLEKSASGQLTLNPFKASEETAES
jgi:exodeoxyribonuclease VII small subunit